MSHALFPGNCASSQVDHVRREARVNYFFFIAISVTKVSPKFHLLRIRAIGNPKAGNLEVKDKFIFSPLFFKNFQETLPTTMTETRALPRRPIVLRRSPHFRLLHTQFRN